MTDPYTQEDAQEDTGSSAKEVQDAWEQAAQDKAKSSGSSGSDE